MGNQSKIEWTDATWNPIRGCSEVSEGCRNCYAMRQAHRFDKPGGPYEGLTRVSGGEIKWTNEVRLVPELLDQPLHWRKPKRIFVNSMSDLFHEKVPDHFIMQVFVTMQKAPQHIYQILTKRPKRMREWVRHFTDREPANVWLGVSCEDQKTANERIPLLLQTPAAIRWISAEPLLGAIDMNGIRNAECGAALDWVVAGGESGPSARPMHPDWARSLRDQCLAAGVPFFFKQWGGIRKHDAGRLLDGRAWNEYPQLEDRE